MQWAIRINPIKAAGGRLPAARPLAVPGAAQTRGRSVLPRDQGCISFSPGLPVPSTDFLQSPFQNDRRARGLPQKSPGQRLPTNSREGEIDWEGRDSSCWAVWRPGGIPGGNAFHPRPGAPGKHFLDWKDLPGEDEVENRWLFSPKPKLSGVLDRFGNLVVNGNTRKKLYI